MSEPANIHIEAKYIEYSNVIEKFTEKKIVDRYHRLLVSAHEFIKGMGYNDNVVCNESMLMYAVLGYFSDIMRLKNFHEIERANDIKIFAYETSWLLKRRPLQIINSNDIKYSFCNEQFAFSQITQWLKDGDGDNGKKALAHDDLDYFSNMLFYHLKYRNNDPQTLELMLVSFLAGRKYQSLISK